MKTNIVRIKALAKANHLNFGFAERTKPLNKLLTSRLSIKPSLSISQVLKS